MRQVVLRTLASEDSVEIKAHYCDTFSSRLRGLTFHSPLSPFEGILLVQGRESRLDSAIHMLGVSFDLAVVWINARWEVVDVQLARAWRPAYFPKALAKYILELDARHLDLFSLGDRFEIIDAHESS